VDHPVSLWRKRNNVRHNEQNQPKWFNMTALANNDLSIKSEDLSIKSEEAMREVQRLGQEIEIEYVLKVEDDDDIQEYKMPWQPLNWGDMPIGQVNNFDFMEGARWAEKSLKDKNA
jgi:hypothetical protein